VRTALAKPEVRYCDGPRASSPTSMRRPRVALAQAGRGQPDRRRGPFGGCERGNGANYLYIILTYAWLRVAGMMEQLVEQTLAVAVPADTLWTFEITFDTLETCTYNRDADHVAK
jgi:hypothetical protein